MIVSVFSFIMLCKQYVKVDSVSIVKKAALVTKTQRKNVSQRMRNIFCVPGGATVLLTEQKVKYKNLYAL